MKNTLAAILAALCLSSCGTLSTGTPQPRDIRNLGAVTTAAAYAATAEKDRDRLTENLNAAATALEALSGTVTAQDVADTVRAFLGSGKPEYVVLTTVAADYLSPAVTDAEARERLAQFAAGIRLATATRK